MVEAWKTTSGHTRHAATAIKTYNTVQTGPNTQAGGFQPGFCSVRYQVPTLVAVKNPPIAHAANAAERNPLNDNQVRMDYNHACSD